MGDKATPGFLCPRCFRPGEKQPRYSYCKACYRQVVAKCSKARRRQHKEATPASSQQAAPVAAKLIAPAAPSLAETVIPPRPADKPTPRQRYTGDRLYFADVKPSEAEEGAAAGGGMRRLVMRGASAVAGRLRELGGRPNKAGAGWLVPEGKYQLAILAVNNPHIYAPDAYIVRADSEEVGDA